MRSLIVQPFFLRLPFLLLPAFEYAMAIAWARGRPERISVAMFWLMTLFELPDFRGTATLSPPK